MWQDASRLVGDKRTTLQFVRVTTQLTDAVNEHMSIVAEMLDVSKAFDQVWHECLLYKLP